MKSKPEHAALREDPLIKIFHVKSSVNEAEMIRLAYCPLAIHKPVMG